jgi:predicted nucleic acid-binding protein
MYLVDTNVISELRKSAKQRSDKNVQAWIKSVPVDKLYTSALCLLELEKGALLLARHDTLQGNALLRWMAEFVRPAFEGRVLAVDEHVASRCAPMHVPDPKSEVDALIAATALVQDFTVVTRNTKDFELLGARLLNPWMAKP